MDLLIFAMENPEKCTDEPEPHQSLPKEGNGGSQLLTTNIIAQAAGHYLVQKAGMNDMVHSKEFIESTIERLTRGSKYWENSQHREKKLSQRVTQMKKELEQVSERQLRDYERQMDAYIERVEIDRHFQKIFAVFDCDAFFALCELRDDPSLQGKPFAVGNLGMICTSSYEARRYGVRSAQPGFIAKELCPDLMFVPVNMKKYVSASEEIKSIFRKYDPNLSAISLDEVYMDLTAYFVAYFRDPNSPWNTCRSLSPDELDPSTWKNPEYPHETLSKSVALREPLSPDAWSHIARVVSCIRWEVQTITRGLTCSAGIASNLLLAKIASNDNKPNGQTLLPWDRDIVLKYMEKLDIRNIPGVGRVTARLLHELGIDKVTDVYPKRAVVRAAFTERFACWLLRSCLGIDGQTDNRTEWRMQNKSDLNAHAMMVSNQEANTKDVITRKSISSERSFAECAHPGILQNMCCDMVRSVCEVMWKHNIACCTISVKVKLGTFEIVQRSHTIQPATNDEETIRKIAVRLLWRLFPANLRLLGVRVSQLSKPVQKHTLLMAIPGAAAITPSVSLPPLTTSPRRSNKLIAAGGNGGGCTSDLEKSTLERKGVGNLFSGTKGGGSTVRGSNLVVVCQKPSLESPTRQGSSVTEPPTTAVKLEEVELSKKDGDSKKSLPDLSSNASIVKSESPKRARQIYPPPISAFFTSKEPSPGRSRGESQTLPPEDFVSNAMDVSSELEDCSEKETTITNENKTSPQKRSRDSILTFFQEFGTEDKKSTRSARRVLPSSGSAAFLSDFLYAPVSAKNIDLWSQKYDTFTSPFVEDVLCISSDDDDAEGSASVGDEDAADGYRIHEAETTFTSKNTYADAKITTKSISNDAKDNASTSDYVIVVDDSDVDS